MSFTETDIREYCHEFALAAIEALDIYLKLLDQTIALLEDLDDSTWGERVSEVRKQSLRVLLNLSPLSTVLTEMDLDSRVGGLPADDDVRSVHRLVQAVLASVAVLAFVESRNEVEDAVVLTPETIGRLLASDRTEAKLAAHFEEATGGKLGDWPVWQPAPGTSTD